MHTSSSALFVVLAALCLPTSVAAQNEAALKEFFEGKKVTVKIDMPASEAGVDIHPQLQRPLDFSKYGDRIAGFGVAIREGDSVLVTLVKLKKDLIEFQLAGGGYGGDSGYVSPEYIGKSNREKQLEDDVKAERDPARKRQLQRQLDDERNRRAREQRRANETARLAQAAKQEQVAQERLRGGSRFNLRYSRTVPAGITPQDVMAALSQYVDFSSTGSSAPAPAAAAAAPPRPVAAGNGLPRKGMLRADAEREFGKPQEVKDRKEGTLKITTLIFLRGEEKITADFVDDVLIRYTISSR